MANECQAAVFPIGILICCMKIRKAEAQTVAPADPSYACSFNLSLDLFSSRKALISLAAPSRRFHCS